MVASFVTRFRGLGAFAADAAVTADAALGARRTRLSNHITDTGTQRLEGCADQSRHLVARR
jgi:hypothetical protein